MGSLMPEGFGCVKYSKSETMVNQIGRLCRPSALSRRSRKNFSITLIEIQIDWKSIRLHASALSISCRMATVRVCRDWRHILRHSRNME
jgi:hypothetical protein